MDNRLHSLTGRTVLVTGANGFLGRPLAEQLTRNRANVHAISRTVPKRHNEKQHWWPGDLTDAVWLQQVMSRIQPDLLFHLASASKGGQDLELVLPTFDVDLRATVNMLVAATQCGAPHVFLVGSLEEPASYGPLEFPASPYAAAKMAAAVYGRMFHHVYQLPVTVLRVFMAYGPGQKSYKVIPYTIRSLLNDTSPELGSATRLLDWVYVDDVITAFLAAAATPESAGLTIELGSGELTSIRDMVQQIHRLIPGAPPLRIGALQNRQKELVRGPADTRLAQDTLGWRATTSIAEGLARTVEWYRNQPDDK
jgi:nucleoside-diphosphate-sugar epimerase